jgi:hypothetical protein
VIPLSGGRRKSQILKAAALQVEEQDAGTVVEGPGGGDWLDACCWRCGSIRPRRDSVGRMLCPPCRAALSEDRTTDSGDPLRVVRDAYWNTHALELCWRCLTEGVDTHDDVGLCPSCVTTLAATETSGDDLTGR